MSALWLAVLLSCGRDGAAPSPGGDAISSVAPRDPSVNTAAAVAPASCDAGTSIWVERVFPLVLGRKPHGAAEVAMWASIADKLGRGAVVRALAGDDSYLDFWKEMISDMVVVSRTSSDNDAPCFQYPQMMLHDGSLTAHIVANAPDGDPYRRPFDMADVILDGLVADDLAPTWQANVFARTNYVAVCCNNPGGKQVEEERRLALGDEFLSTYPNRNLTCMTCHNSEFSTTDNADPLLDHTWGVDAYFEKALFGDSAGPVDPDTYYAVHRYYQVVDDVKDQADGVYPVQPWGMSAVCGSFQRLPPREDYLGVDEAYLGSDLGPQGSIWDIEGMLRSGNASLLASPLAIGADESVAGDQALSYLTAQHVVDQVWNYAVGARLTLPYGFSRNQPQQEQLQALTDQFVADGWSLRELLVSIATSPVFNDGLPGTCGADPYGLDPIVNPYAADDPDPAVHGNGPGDLVHRQFARALVRSARDELEWPVAREYFGADTTDPDYQLERAVGVFLSRSIAGFNGTDFQGALTWEKRFATCSDPAYPSDFLTRARRAALQANATVEDLALAVKDRLTARGVFEDDEERDLTEDLLGFPLSTPVAEADPVALGRNIGLYCGGLTLTPDFFVTVEPRAPGPVPKLPLDYEADCEQLAGLLSLQGVAVTCDNWVPVLP